MCAVQHFHNRSKFVIDCSVIHLVLLAIKYWVENCTMHALVFTSGYEFVTDQDSEHGPRNHPSQKMANQITLQVSRAIKN